METFTRALFEHLVTILRGVGVDISRLQLPTSLVATCYDGYKPLSSCLDLSSIPGFSVKELNNIFANYDGIARDPTIDISSAKLRILELERQLKAPVNDVSMMNSMLEPEHLTLVSTSTTVAETQTDVSFFENHDPRLSDDEYVLSFRDQRLTDIFTQLKTLSDETLKPKVLSCFQPFRTNKDQVDLIKSLEQQIAALSTTVKTSDSVESLRQELNTVRSQLIEVNRVNDDLSFRLCSHYLPSGFQDDINRLTIEINKQSRVHRDLTNEIKSLEQRLNALQTENKRICTNYNRRLDRKDEEIIRLSCAIKSLKDELNWENHVTVDEVANQYLLSTFADFKSNILALENKLLVADNKFCRLQTVHNDLCASIGYEISFSLELEKIKLRYAHGAALRNYNLGTYELRHENSRLKEVINRDYSQPIFSESAATKMKYDEYEQALNSINAKHKEQLETRDNVISTLRSDLTSTQLQLQELQRTVADQENLSSNHSAHAISVDAINQKLKDNIATLEDKLEQSRLSYQNLKREFDSMSNRSTTEKRNSNWLDTMDTDMLSIIKDVHRIQTTEELEIRLRGTTWASTLSYVYDKQSAERFAKGLELVGLKLDIPRFMHSVQSNAVTTPKQLSTLVMSMISTPSDDFDDVLTFISAKGPYYKYPETYKFKETDITTAIVVDNRNIDYSPFKRMFPNLSVFTKVKLGTSLSHKTKYDLIFLPFGLESAVFKLSPGRNVIARNYDFADDLAPICSLLNMKSTTPSAITGLKSIAYVKRESSNLFRCYTSLSCAGPSIDCFVQLAADIVPKVASTVSDTVVVNNVVSVPSTPISLSVLPPLISSYVNIAESDIANDCLMRVSKAVNNVVFKFISPLTDVLPANQPTESFYIGIALDMLVFNMAVGVPYSFSFASIHARYQYNLTKFGDSFINANIVLPSSIINRDCLFYLDDDKLVIEEINLRSNLDLPSVLSSKLDSLISRNIVKLTRTTNTMADVEAVLDQLLSIPPVNVNISSMIKLAIDFRLPEMFGFDNNVSALIPQFIDNPHALVSFLYAFNRNNSLSKICISDVEVSFVLGAFFMHRLAKVSDRFDSLMRFNVDCPFSELNTQIATVLSSSDIFIQMSSAILSVKNASFVTLPSMLDYLYVESRLQTLSQLDPLDVNLETRTLLSAVGYRKFDELRHLSPLTFDSIAKSFIVSNYTMLLPSLVDLTIDVLLSGHCKMHVIFVNNQGWKFRFSFTVDKTTHSYLISYKDVMYMYLSMIRGFICNYTNYRIKVHDMFKSSNDDVWISSVNPAELLKVFVSAITKMFDTPKTSRLAKFFLANWQYETIDVPTCPVHRIFLLKRLDERTTNTKFAAEPFNCNLESNECPSCAICVALDFADNKQYAMDLLFGSRLARTLSLGNSSVSPSMYLSDSLSIYHSRYLARSLSSPMLHAINTMYVSPRDAYSSVFFRHFSHSFHILPMN